MIYSVTYFNPYGNCDNTVHVEAENEVDAALIAHADFWVASRSFNLDDYNVLEYNPEYIIKKDDVLAKNYGWTEDKLKEAKKEALKDYVIKNWKYGYRKDGKKGLKLLEAEVEFMFGKVEPCAVQDILLKSCDLDSRIVDFTSWGN